MIMMHSRRLSDVDGSGLRMACGTFGKALVRLHVDYVHRGKLVAMLSKIFTPLLEPGIWLGTLCCGFSLWFKTRTTWLNYHECSAPGNRLAVSGYPRA